MASSDSSIMSRWRAGSMPIMKASEGRAPGTHAEHDAAPGEVVEQDDAVGQDEGLVVGQGGDARAQPDVRGALRRGGDEHLGRRDDLEAGRVVFAEPGLVEAQAVQVLDQLQVALERQRRVLPDRVERGQEDAEPEAPVGVNACHCSPFLLHGLTFWLGGSSSWISSMLDQDLAVLARGCAACRRRPGRRPGPPRP